MPTLEQIRAARALLGWNQTDLADRAGLSQTGIARIENGTNHPNSQTLRKIEEAFDKADIEFIDTSGVRKRENYFRTLRGSEGMREFLNDVYEVLSTEGGEFCIFNASPLVMMEWMDQELWDMHRERMVGIKNKISGKIIVKRDLQNFVASGYAEYRRFDDNEYDERKTLYSYGNRLVFLDFKPEDLVITIMERHEFAHAYRVIFNSAWKQTQPISF